MRVYKFMEKFRCEKITIAIRKTLTAAARAVPDHFSYLFVCLPVIPNAISCCNPESASVLFVFFGGLGLRGKMSRVVTDMWFLFW